ncbi:MAG: DUF805 domain-containing protein [Paludibacter sp.]
MNWYVDVLKKYAEFSGRARRKEYWYFFLINFLIAFSLNFFGFSTISTIYSWAVLIPSIAVGVRRMHDVDKSGWYLLFPIYNLILLFTEGDTGRNDYGNDPKEEYEYSGSYENVEPEDKPTEINSDDSVEPVIEPKNMNERFMPHQIWDIIKEETIENQDTKTKFVPKKKPIKPNTPKQT